MIHSETVSEIAKGLAKFHAALEGIAKNRSVNYSGRNFQYADLSAIWSVIRKPLASAGLSVIQTLDGGSINTLLLHESGEYISSSMTLGIAPNVDHKQLGAAITYMRRYTLVALLSLATEEDEGESPEAKVAVSPLPDNKTLTPEQVVKLKDAIGADVEFMANILKANGVSRLEEIPLKNLQPILVALGRKNGAA